MSDDNKIPLEAYEPNVKPGPKLDEDRAERISKGILMIAEGVPKAKAARLANISRASLCAHYDRARTGDPKAMLLLENRVIGHAVEIADESGSQILKALKAGEYKPSQLPTIFGISMDKLAAKRQWSRGDRSASHQSDIATVLQAIDRAAGESGEASFEIKVNRRQPTTTQARMPETSPDKQT